MEVVDGEVSLDIEGGSGLRQRSRRPPSPPPPTQPPQPSTTQRFWWIRALRRRTRARESDARSEHLERLDRDERRMGLYVMIALLCAVCAAVAAHRAILAWAGDAPAEAAPPHKDRFIFTNRSNWTEYERGRSACARPSDAEAAVWASTGVACARGDCLEIAYLLRIMRALAARDGEAYSTMGRTARNAPLPCACAFRGDDGRVEAYLDPREKSRSGDMFVARVEIEVFGGTSARLEVPETATIEHRAWPSGAKVEVVATGTESARWSAAWFVMNL